VPHCYQWFLSPPLQEYSGQIQPKTSGEYFLIDIITAVIGVAIVFFCVKLSYAQKTERLRYICGTAWIKTLFIAFALFSVLASPAAMRTPLQVARAFGDNVWQLTVIEILFCLTPSA
jgi:DHA3 family macrolide efflux protein-like MFS transporter